MTTSPVQQICDIARHWWPNRTVETRYAIVDDSIRIYATDMEPTVLAAALLAIVHETKLPPVLVIVQGKDGAEAFIGFKWLLRKA